MTVPLAREQNGHWKSVASTMVTLAEDGPVTGLSPMAILKTALGSSEPPWGRSAGREGAAACEGALAATTARSGAPTLVARPRMKPNRAPTTSATMTFTFT